MTYLERYHRGECVGVWNDLQALGPNVRQEPDYAQALAVAAETMRRVHRNCARLVSHFHAIGYGFDTFPDGKRRTFAGPPLTHPSGQLRADCAELESQAGPLPLSLGAFWQEVGAVDLVGRLGIDDVAGYPHSPGDARQQVTERGSDRTETVTIIRGARARRLEVAGGLRCTSRKALPPATGSSPPAATDASR